MALSIKNSEVLLGDSVPISGYPFSFVGWFRVSDVNHYVPLVGFTDSLTNTRHEIFFAGYASNKPAGALSYVGSAASAQSTSSMVPGQWHHLVAVFSSDTYRKIILDGGNSGINTSSRAFAGADTFYIGNKNTSSRADVAELAVIGASVSDSQAATLAKGCPVLASPLSNDVVAYYDLIRQKNRPGLGPTITSNLSPAVVEHPPVILPRGCRTTVMPRRMRGPFHIGQGGFRSHSAEQGQLAASGVVSNNTILSGEMSS